MKKIYYELIAFLASWLEGIAQLILSVSERLSNKYVQWLKKEEILAHLTPQATPGEFYDVLCVCQNQFCDFVGNSDSLAWESTPFADVQVCPECRSFVRPLSGESITFDPAIPI